jgi:hypothetical protein
MCVGIIWDFLRWVRDDTVTAAVDLSPGDKLAA